MNNFENIVKQLNSGAGEALDGALKYLLKFDEWPEEVLAVLVTILNRHKENLTETMARVISLSVDTRLAELYLSLFQGNHSQVMAALSSVEKWCESGEIKEKIKLILKKLMVDNGDLSVRFLAMLCYLRIYGDHDLMCSQIANLIAYSEQDDVHWWRSLRTEAQEQMTEEEIHQVNVCLVRLNVHGL